MVGGILIFRRCDTKSFHVFFKNLGVFFGVFQRINAFFLCSLDDLVVYVGDILDIINFVSFVPKIFCDNIKNNKSPRIAYVYIVIDRRTADEHLDLFACLSGRQVFARFEYLFFSCQRVINFHKSLICNMF